MQRVCAYQSEGHWQKSAVDFLQVFDTQHHSKHTNHTTFILFESDIFICKGQDQDSQTMKSSVEVLER